jgi:hypothetical protein
MWVANQTTGKVTKFKTDGTKVGCFPVADDPTKLLAGPYTYSDLTGSTNALVTSQLGRWRAVIEREKAIQWALVAYKADKPEGTTICVRVRSADTKSALQTSNWSAALCDADEVGDYSVHKLVDGTHKVVDASKFLEIELQLNSSDKEVTPSVKGLSVAGLK